MFPIGGSSPQAAAERRRQEEMTKLREQYGEGLEAHPGIAALREAAEADKENKRLEEETRQALTQAHLAEKASEELAGVESRTKAAYLAAGGSDSDWVTAWPSIREDYLKQRAAAPVDYYSAVRSAF